MVRVVRRAFIAIIVAGMLLVTGRARASVIFPSDEQASLDLGRTMASNDLVRQLQFDITGGSISRVDGTAAPLGSWYSGMSKHYIDYVINASGSSNFAITVSTGPSRAERTQTIPIAHMYVHPTLDFVLLEHAVPVTAATNPAFGALMEDGIITSVGYGDRYKFGSSDHVNDGQPSAFRATLQDVSSPAFVTITSQANSFSGPFAIPGGGAQFDSSSPGYNASGQLAFLLEGGIFNPLSPPTHDYGLGFVSSGLSDWIDANTPLNVPEPAGLMFIALAAGGLRRRRTGRASLGSTGEQ